jgi:hypothetical protein
MSDIKYDIDETGNPVYEIPISLIAKEAQLSQGKEPVTIGWYTDYHGVRGDIAIRMGLVEADPWVRFDYTEPTPEQLADRYGNTNIQY